MPASSALLCEGVRLRLLAPPWDTPAGGTVEAKVLSGVAMYTRAYHMQIGSELPVRVRLPRVCLKTDLIGRHITHVRMQPQRLSRQQEESQVFTP